MCRDFSQGRQIETNCRFKRIAKQCPSCSLLHPNLSCCRCRPGWGEKCSLAESQSGASCALCSIASPGQSPLAKTNSNLLPMPYQCVVQLTVSRLPMSCTRGSMLKKLFRLITQLPPVSKGATQEADERQPSGSIPERYSDEREKRISPKRVFEWKFGLGGRLSSPVCPFIDDIVRGSRALRISQEGAAVLRIFSRNN